MPDLITRAKARATALIRFGQVRPSGDVVARAAGSARAMIRTADPRYLGHFEDEASIPTSGVRDGDWLTLRGSEAVSGPRGALRVGGVWRVGRVENRGPFATRETDDLSDVALRSKAEGDASWRLVIDTAGNLTWTSGDDPITWAVALTPVATPNFAAGASLVTLGGLGAAAFAREDDDDHFIIWGTGSPESVVAASKGSIYLRVDGDVGTTVYIKQSGTGNTGWYRLPWFPLALLDAAAATDPVVESRVSGDSFVRYRLSVNGNELLGGDGTALPAVRRVIGSGSPEGVVVAGVGSTYHRTDGGAGTSFYVKESGSGNVGWVGK